MDELALWIKTSVLAFLVAEDAELSKFVSEGFGVIPVLGALLFWDICVFPGMQKLMKKSAEHIPSWEMKPARVEVDLFPNSE